MKPYADISTAKVKLPDGEEIKGRFIFWDGSAAVWQTIRGGGATRLFFAKDTTFEKRVTARFPHKLIMSDGSIIEVRQVSGGCGCGGKNPLSSFSLEQLTEPDRVSIA